MALHNRWQSLMSHSAGLNHATATPFGTDTVGWLCFLTHTITHGSEQGQWQWNINRLVQNPENGKNEGGLGPFGVKYIKSQWFNFMQTVPAVRLEIALQEMPRQRANFQKSVTGYAKGGPPPLQTPGKGGGPPFESPPNMVLRGPRAKKNVIFESAMTLTWNGHKNNKLFLVSSFLRVWVNA